MLYRALADMVVIVHFAFVLFVVGGAFLVLRWRRLAWVHVPAAVWGSLIEFAGWVCPRRQPDGSAGDNRWRGRHRA